LKKGRPEFKLATVPLSSFFTHYLAGGTFYSGKMPILVNFSAPSSHPSLSCISFSNTEKSVPVANVAIFRLRTLKARKFVRKQIQELSKEEKEKKDEIQKLCQEKNVLKKLS